MKKNLFLLSIVIIIGLFSLEHFASFQINRLIKRNGYTKELIDFYNYYHKELHHLGRLNEVDSKIPSSLMFDEIGNGASCIVIQGDSWAEQYRIKKSKKYLLKFLQKQEKYKFILAGTGSYSPSIMTSQLFLLRKDFDHNPEFLVAVIDQTDIGDEICRYKKLRKKIKGRIIVEPEPANSIEYNSAILTLDNFKMFFSDNFSIIKVLNYFKNIYTQKKNQKIHKIRCNRDQILDPLENGLKPFEEEYMINILEDYFKEAFSSPVLKKMIIITHPHKKHLSGEYVLNIDDLIYKAKIKSKYNKRIKIVSFFKHSKNHFDGDLNNIFVENDAYSHLKENYFLSNILPKVLDEIN